MGKNVDMTDYYFHLLYKKNDFSLVGETGAPGGSLCKHGEGHANSTQKALLAARQEC